MSEMIYKKGENTWLVRVFMGRDAEGKQQFHNKTVHGTKKDAQAYRMKVLRDRDLGEWVEPTEETVRAYLERWLAEAAGPRIAPATMDMYRGFIKGYFAIGLGDLRLDKIAPLDVQAFYGGLATRGLGPARIRRVHGMLHSALNQAVRWGLLRQNPASLVDKPKIRKPEIKAIDPEAVVRFLEAATVDRHSTLWAFMLETGVRPGEALALRWKDVDIKAGSATIGRSLTWRANGEYVFTGTKTGTTRPLPLSAELVADLREHRRTQLEERFAAGPTWEDLDLVFATEAGTPHRRENLSKRHLKPILKVAGLPEDLTLYSLRHSYATLALAEGLHPKVVAERLGHASVKHTLDTYSHITPTMQAGATETLASRLYRRSAR